MKNFYSTENIYTEIRRDIIDLKLYPGKLISENEMAQKYNVSRTVIRPAFTKLKGERFITVYPQRGTIISLIDLAYVHDLIYLREAVEKQICIDTAKAMKVDVMFEIELNLKKQDQFLLQNIYNSECRELDEEFHRLLFKLAGKQTVWDLMSNNTLHFQRYRNLDINFSKRIVQIINEHHEIYNAIIQKDTKKLNQINSNHLCYSMLNICSDVVNHYPMYFTNLP
ncbi:MAG: GntR family transcriptional regulator [Cellulosilyticaceae bacterium]